MFWNSDCCSIPRLKYFWYDFAVYFHESLQYFMFIKSLLQLVYD